MTSEFIKPEDNSKDVYILSGYDDCDIPKKKEIKPTTQNRNYSHNFSLKDDYQRDTIINEDRPLYVTRPTERKISLPIPRTLDEPVYKPRQCYTPPKTVSLYVPAFTNISFDSTHKLVLRKGKYYIDQNECVKNISAFNGGKETIFKIKYSIYFDQNSSSDQYYSPFLEMTIIHHDMGRGIMNFIFQILNQISFTHTVTRKVVPVTNTYKIIDSLLAKIATSLTNELNTLCLDINDACNVQLSATNIKLCTTELKDMIIATLPRQLDVDINTVKQIISSANVIGEEPVPLSGQYIIKDNKLFSLNGGKVSVDIGLSCMINVTHIEEGITWYAAAFIYRHSKNSIYKCNISNAIIEESLPQKGKFKFQKITFTDGYKGDNRKLISSNIDIENNNGESDDIVMIGGDFCFNDDNTQSLTLFDMDSCVKLNNTLCFYREHYEHNGWARRAGAARYPIKPDNSEFFIEDFSSPVKVYIGIIN